MGTNIRPEISEKSRYYISRHRYYELKHFCLQYQEWKDDAKAILRTLNHPQELSCVSHLQVSPVEDAAIKLYSFTARTEMIENAAKQTDSFLANYILIGVTQGLTWNHLSARYHIPCSKDMYYEFYSKFFWILSKARN